jgi:hypothetical protein
MPVVARRALSPYRPSLERTQRRRYGVQLCGAATACFQGPQAELNMEVGLTGRNRGPTTDDGWDSHPIVDRESLRPGLNSNIGLCRPNRASPHFGKVRMGLRVTPDSLSRTASLI